MKRGIVVIFYILIFCAVALPQKDKDEMVKVKGTVTAFERFNLENVEITAKKTKSTVLTDSLGQFEILAQPGDALLFSANGFEKNRRKAAKNQEPMTVNMILMDGEKHRKVAVGYGHMSEKDLTYAISNFSDLNNDYLKYTDMSDLLRRELVGVRVDGLKVYSQGSENVMNRESSTNTGEAVYVVNGIITSDIGYLTPRDIKSIRMLKGAEAAIYGSRSANGVILIETK